MAVTFSTSPQQVGMPYHRRVGKTMFARSMLLLLAKFRSLAPPLVPHGVVSATCEAIDPVRAP
jgi:hypothetical protein